MEGLSTDQMKEMEREAMSRAKMAAIFSLHLQSGLPWDVCEEWAYRLLISQDSLGLEIKEVVPKEGDKT